MKYRNFLEKLVIEGSMYTVKFELLPAAKDFHKLLEKAPMHLFVGLYRVDKMIIFKKHHCDSPEDLQKFLFKYLARQFTVKKQRVYIMRT
jgi:hypothetical protein